MVHFHAISSLYIPAQLLLFVTQDPHLSLSLSYVVCYCDVNG